MVFRVKILFESRPPENQVTTQATRIVAEDTSARAGASRIKMSTQSRYTEALQPLTESTDQAKQDGVHQEEANEEKHQKTENDQTLLLKTAIKDSEEIKKRRKKEKKKMKKKWSAK